MLQKPERGRGGTTECRWEWQSKVKKCWECWGWGRESVQKASLPVYFYSSCVPGRGRERARGGNNGAEQQLRRHSGLRRTPSLMKFTSILLPSHSPSLTLWLWCLSSAFPQWIVFLASLTTCLSHLHRWRFTSHFSHLFNSLYFLFFSLLALL